MIDKILLIGWDGASWNYIDPLLDEGELPNIKSLIDVGTRSTLKSTIPPYTNIAWPSLVTGRRPDKTGVFDGTKSIIESYQSIPTNLTGFRGIPIWNWLDRYGLRSGVLNVPMTYPAQPLQGYLISGFDSPINSPQIAYPEDVLSTWAEEGHSYQILTDEISLMSIQNPHQDRGHISDFVSRWVDLTIHQGEYIAWLWQEHPVDFLFTVFSGTDSINHRTNDSIQINKIYEAADIALGKILNVLDDNTLVCVVSDHGSIAAHRYISLYHALHVGGWLNFQSMVAKRYIRRIPIFGNHFQRYWTCLPDILKRLISMPMLWLEPKLVAAYDNIDWRRTICYSRSSMGPLYINLADKKPQGSISPDEYNLTKLYIREYFLGLTDKKGDLIFRNVHLIEDTYPNSKPEDDPPDFILEPYKWSDHMITGFPDDSLVRPIPDRNEYGTHTPDGIFIMSGPGVAQDMRLEMFNIIDIVPTLLATWGLPIPDSVDGEVIQSAFTSEMKVKRAPDHFGDERFIVNANIKYTDEIRERLEALGYMD